MLLCCPSASSVNHAFAYKMAVAGAGGLAYMCVQASFKIGFHSLPPSYPFDRDNLLG